MCNSLLLVLLFSNLTLKEVAPLVTEALQKGLSCQAAARPHLLKPVRTDMADWDQAVVACLLPKGSNQVLSPNQHLSHVLPPQEAAAMILFGALSCSPLARERGNKRLILCEWGQIRTNPIYEGLTLGKKISKSTIFLSCMIVRQRINYIHGHKSSFWRFSRSSSSSSILAVMISFKLIKQERDCSSQV